MRPCTPRVNQRYDAPNASPTRPFRWTRFLVVAAAAVITAGATALLVNIFERKQEARNPFYRVVELTESTEDPAVWGKNFPFQYDTYRRTTDIQRTRYGGSEAMPRTPSQADPRSIVAQSRLEADPRLKTMWAGYAFARDFREDRGHAFMLDDQTYTERQHAVQQPGTCLHCHASVYVPYTKAGGGDLMKGFAQFNQLTFQLRATRPGFIEGIRTFKAGQGVKDYDVNNMGPRGRRCVAISAASATLSTISPVRRNGWSIPGLRTYPSRPDRL